MRPLPPREWLNMQPGTFHFHDGTNLPPEAEKPNSIHSMDDIGVVVKIKDSANVGVERMLFIPWSAISYIEHQTR